MQFALVTGQRTLPIKGGKGTCPICSAELIAKCGPRVIHHWAHNRQRNCDPWWENETEWHRKWKELFPEDCREISLEASSGEIHRADVKTRSGIVIEIQHSTMTDEERLSRELFYGNLVWVLDGSTFQQNFFILHSLPDPNWHLSDDLVWFPANKDGEGSRHGMCYRRSENEPGASMVLVCGDNRLVKEAIGTSIGHRQFCWVRPRKAWLESKCPVYIDFGQDYIWKLMLYGEQKLPCIYPVSKEKFVHDAMVEQEANAIATRFYKINP